jgi:hypothetical protein
MTSQITTQQYRTYVAIETAAIATGYGLGKYVFPALFARVGSVAGQELAAAVDALRVAGSFSKSVVKGALSSQNFYIAARCTGAYAAQSATFRYTLDRFARGIDTLSSSAILIPSVSFKSLYQLECAMGGIALHAKDLGMSLGYFVQSLAGAIGTSAADD